MSIRISEQTSGILICIDGAVSHYNVAATIDITQANCASSVALCLDVTTVYNRIVKVVTISACICCKSTGIISVTDDIASGCGKIASASQCCNASGTIPCCMNFILFRIYILHIIGLRYNSGNIEIALYLAVLS